MYAFSNTNLELKTHNKGSHVILNSYHPIFVPIRDIHHHTVCNIPWRRYNRRVIGLIQQITKDG